MNLDPQHLARVLGGEYRGREIRAPGPGHSAVDRSLCIKLDPAAPDGFIAHSQAGDDDLACKDYVRQKAGLPAWEPSGGNRDDPVGRISGRAASPATEYIYRDEAGEPVRKVIRRAGKRFSQHRWTGTGWQPGTSGIRRLPYRLPEMLAAVHDAIFICEGEKDADRLASLGFVATTNEGGAGNWKSELNEWFKGKSCYISEDNDEAGRKHAAAVAAQIGPVATSVRVVSLPGLPDKGDVSDWLDADPKRSATLLALAGQAPLWTEPYLCPRHLHGRGAREIFPGATLKKVSAVLEGITIREFARRAGVDEKTIRRKVQSQHLPAFADGSLDPAHVHLDWRTGPIEVSTLADTADSFVDSADTGADTGRRSLNSSLVRQVLAEEGQNIGGASLTLTHIRMAVGILKAREQSRLNDIARGDVVQIEEVGAAVEAEYAVVRANLLALPGDIADDLVGLDAVAVEELLTSKMAEILDELAADGKYGAGNDDPD